MTRKSKKQIQTQSQSGRSMIEMLGVLAIIAILSIGGIVGFRLAMNYYQANQIAHEMNMMRTDAQIKIAQGAEELMLGDPYDSGNIQFNGYKTDFDCLYLETETSAPDDVASCAVANAYYIELLEIPEGVCKPLANLIDKMDNEIAFYINGNSVDAAEEEKGACNAEFNTLKVIFGADSDSNAVKCDTDAECESLETTPVCDTERHVCVECKEDDDCPYNTDYCENNVCKTCESGVWNGTDCVECTTDDDCTDTPDTPKCNTTANQCVQCLTYNDCTNPATPKCNTDTNTCEACPPKSVFYEGECREYDCRSNEDCADKGSDYYCYVKEGYEREQEFVDDPSDDDFGGQCRNASTDASWAENKKYALSTVDMNWYSAFRFCKKLNKRVPSYTDLGYSKGCLGCPTTITQQIKEDFPNVADIWLVEEVAGSSGLVWGFNFERYDLMNQQPKRGGLTDHPVELNYTLCLD